MSLLASFSSYIFYTVNLCIYYTFYFPRAYYCDYQQIVENVVECSEMGVTSAQNPVSNNRDAQKWEY